jgi:hypothetical protein
MHTVIAILLLCHGFITTAIGWGAVTRPDSPAVQLPSWLHWWPGPFGRSWLVDALHLGKGWAIAVGLVWLGAGLLLVLGAFGLLGVPLLRDSSPIILLAGASLALAALTVSFHPIYLVAVLINIAVLSGVTGRLPLTESVLPSVEAQSMNQTRSQT